MMLRRRRGFSRRLVRRRLGFSKRRGFGRRRGYASGIRRGEWMGGWR